MPRGEEQVRPLRLLLSGERGSGKTTLCLKTVEVLRQRGLRCGGVLCPKVFGEQGEILGIEAVDVAGDSKVRRLLARTDRVLNGPVIGPYSFSAEGLRFAQLALAGGAARGDILFADELGPLEMRGAGLVNLLPLALDAAVPPMVITVRPSLVPEVQEKLKGLRVLVVNIEAAGREQAERELLRNLF